MKGSDVSEGDVNTGQNRRDWVSALDAATTALLALDEAVFFRQALSTPCLDSGH